MPTPSSSKVSSIGARGALILRVGGRERAALAKEARELRAVMVDAISHAEASASRCEPADARELDKRYAELLDLAYVLTQLEHAPDSTDPGEIIGPSDLLIELAHGTAVNAAARMADAISHHRDSASSRRELRKVSEAAAAAIDTFVECETLAGLWRRQIARPQPLR